MSDSFFCICPVRSTLINVFVGVCESVCLMFEIYRY